MGKKEPRVYLCVMVEEHVKDVLGRMSVERDMSMSAICRQLINEEVRKYECKEESVKDC